MVGVLECWRERSGQLTGAVVLASDFRLRPMKSASLSLSQLCFFLLVFIPPSWTSYYADRPVRTHAPLLTPPTNARGHSEWASLVTCRPRAGSRYEDPIAVQHGLPLIEIAIRSG